MRHRKTKRSRPRNERLQESIRLYFAMQRASTEEEFAPLLQLHDACTDADGKPRLVPRTLSEFRRFTGIPK